MADAGLTLRPASPDEGPALSGLALRSKAHWPYSDEFLAACRRELTYTRDNLLAPDRVFVVAGLGGGQTDTPEVNDLPPAGFFQLLKLSDLDIELVALFVDPPAIGCGVGRALWIEALQKAKELGGRRLIIFSDPYAEPFYLAMGATRDGDVASGSVPGRRLPRLIYDLTGHGLSKL